MQGLDREIFPLQHDCLPEVGTEGGFHGYMKKQKAHVEGQINAKSGYNSLRFDKGHENMLNSFVDAILNDKPSPCDELAGFTATYLSKLAIRSIELRQALPVQIEKLTPCMV